jgi:hypothetical protein
VRKLWLATKRAPQLSTGGAEKTFRSCLDRFGVRGSDRGNQHSLCITSIDATDHDNALDHMETPVQADRTLEGCSHAESINVIKK